MSPRRNAEPSPPSFQVVQFQCQLQIGNAFFCGSRTVFEVGSSQEMSWPSAHAEGRFLRGIIHTLDIAFVLFRSLSRRLVCASFCLRHLVLREMQTLLTRACTHISCAQAILRCPEHSV
ncbi:hypothetical protein MRB53_038612 [Persea americana]|nr:hypothetical protein MRB53_038612 [Persea americana]